MSINISAWGSHWGEVALFGHDAIVISDDLSEIRVLAGHQPFGDQWFVKLDGSKITILGDPLEPALLVAINHCN
jgi:hypothetical protein